MTCDESETPIGTRCNPGDESLAINENINQYLNILVTVNLRRDMLSMKLCVFSSLYYSGRVVVDWFTFVFRKRYKLHINQTNCSIGRRLGISEMEAEFVSIACVVKFQNKCGKDLSSLDRFPLEPI